MAEFLRLYKNVSFKLWKHNAHAKQIRQDQHPVCRTPIKLKNNPIDVFPGQWFIVNPNTNL